MKVMIKQNKKYYLEEVYLIANNKADILVENTVLENVKKNFAAVKKY